MKKPAGKSSSRRRDNYTVITLIALTGALIFRIPLRYMIGEKGIAYFGAANEIYLVIAGTFAYGLSEAVAVLIRYRVKREQYKSAGKVLKGALVLGGAIGALLSIIFGFFGHGFSETVLNAPLSGMAVCLMAPSMFFIILTGVFRGYFQGNGSRVPAMHSQLLHTLFLITGGLIGAGLFSKYGEKVSALLQNEDYTSAYGAMGASIGFLAASLMCFLHSLVLYFIFSKNVKRQMGREQQKNQDTGFRVFHMLIGTGALYSLFWFSFHAYTMLDQYLYFKLAAGDTVSQWGVYYGECLVITGIIIGLITIVCLLPIRRILTFMERSEHRLAREKLGILIHQCAALTIPAAVFLAVLAENILDLLFQGSNKQAVSWLQLGSLVIVFQVFAAVFMEILIRSRKIKYVTGMGAIALLLHLGITALLLNAGKLGIMAVLLGVIVFYAAVAVMGFLLVSRSFEYRQEWLKTFAFTIVASAVSGVAAMLLNKVLAPLAGEGISLLICLVAAVIIYLILLIAVRAFKEEELEETAGGRLLIMLAGLLHLSGK